jgi:hypothetical protein
MSNKQSPLQVVNARFGSKQDLVKQLSSVLEPGPGETAEELADRLARVSNAKLLHLQGLADKVTAHGGREGLVQKIAAAENKAGDQDYVKALTEKRTLGWLVDRIEMHAKRAKQAS